MEKRCCNDDADGDDDESSWTSPLLAAAALDETGVGVGNVLVATKVHCLSDLETDVDGVLHACGSREGQ